MSLRALAPETSARLNGLRILIAEDEPLLSMEVEDAIREHGGVPVGPYATLDALMAAVSAGGYDVAILDVHLGREESFAAADALRQRRVPFVFHSGRADGGELCCAYPQAPLCRKPCAPERLLETAVMTMDKLRAA